MQTQSVGHAIARAVSSSAPRERVRSLKAVRWTLRSGSLYVGPVNPATLETPLVADRSQALVFDGRDNHETRALFFGRLFSAPFTAELL